jgi:hypothetical protein
MEAQICADPDASVNANTAGSSRNSRASAASVAIKASAKTRTYDRWRDYDAEDSVRFYALRLHDVGLIK